MTRRRGPRLQWIFPWFLLAGPVLAAGCAASLPDVKMIVESSLSRQRPPEIVDAQGRLSPAESRQVLAGIRKRVESEEILERHAAVMELVDASPLVKDNRATLLIDGPRTYDAIFRAIGNARDHVHVETYIIRDDEIGRKLGDALLRKRAEGVPVRLLYDSYGCIKTPESFFQRLRDGGVQVLEFNPVDPLQAGGNWRLIHRDHRKILVADGKLAITGGVNVSAEYAGSLRGSGSAESWRDTDVQIEGPAVAEFQKLFLDTWRRQKGPALPEGNYFPDLAGKPMGDDLVRVVGSRPAGGTRLTYIMYVSAFLYARKSIHLTNAYFVPDKQTIEALTGAAKRGVDVRIILPGDTDVSTILYAGRYYYTRLLEAGVKLYEHRSAVLHAKTAVIDGVWSTVGSANMDMWSFTRNDEVNAVILGREFAGQMEEMFARDLSESDAVDLEKWRKRPIFHRIREWFGHLVRYWL